jgi:hypothetical protein
VTYLDGVEGMHVNSFQWSNGDIIHVIQVPDGSYKYLLTFDVPKIRFVAKYPTESVSTSADITFKSGTNSFTLTQNIQITVADSMIMDI